MNKIFILTAFLSTISGVRAEESAGTENPAIQRIVMVYMPNLSVGSPEYKEIMKFTSKAIERRKQVIEAARLSVDLLTGTEWDKVALALGTANAPENSYSQAVKAQAQADFDALKALRAKLLVDTVEKMNKDLDKADEEERKAEDKKAHDTTPSAEVGTNALSSANSTLKIEVNNTNAPAKEFIPK